MPPNEIGRAKHRRAFLLSAEWQFVSASCAPPTDLEPGVLYEFCYNTPPAISKTAVLRIPDYQNRTWKKANG